MSDEEENEESGEQKGADSKTDSDRFKAIADKVWLVLERSKTDLAVRDRVFRARFAGRREAPP